LQSAGMMLFALGDYDYCEDVTGGVLLEMGYKNYFNDFEGIKMFIKYGSDDG
jgi:hypothetical protein